MKKNPTYRHTHTHTCSILCMKKKLPPNTNLSTVIIQNLRLINPTAAPCETLRES